jgi:cation:H+ antiporter
MGHLIPQTFVDQQPTLVLLVLLTAGIAALVKGAGWLVEGAVGLSERLGMPKVIIGATIVSLGTTTPEAAVSVMAAFRGMPDFALGNSVGSIICDTGMIFGICCLLTRLPKDRFVLNRHGWVQLGSGILLVVVSLLFWNADRSAHVLPRFVGVCFIVLLVGYLALSVRWAGQHKRHALGTVRGVGVARGRLPGRESMPQNAILLVTGLAVVLAASRVSIEVAQSLCRRWGVPPGIVAATLIAFGTSLPELATAIASIRKGHPDLLIGNIIGADILNVLFVTGAAACAAPLTVDPLFYRLHFPVMIAVLVLFRAMIHLGEGSFARWPGILLLGLYAFYAVANYIMVER